MFITHAFILPSEDRAALTYELRRCTPTDRFDFPRLHDNVPQPPYKLRELVAESKGVYSNHERSTNLRISSPFPLILAVRASTASGAAAEEDELIIRGLAKLLFLLLPDPLADRLL